MNLIIENQYNAEALAVFCKRVTFDDCYRRANGENETERKAMAYRMLSALSAVEECLKNEGYAPR